MLLALFLSLLPSAALADAIDGPPACPPGARGESSHSGTACVPWTCAADADCEAGARCEERRLCSFEASVAFGGRRRPDEDIPPRLVRVVVASCGASEACTGTEEPWPPTYGAHGTPTCAAQRVCVAPSGPSIGDFLGVTAPEEPASETPPAPPSSPVPAPTAAPPASGGLCAARVPGASAAPALALIALALLLGRRRT